MRMTLDIDDDALTKAAKLTGAREKTAIVRMELEALIALESSKRLAELGDTEKCLRAIPRGVYPSPWFWLTPLYESTIYGLLRHCWRTC